MENCTVVTVVEITPSSCVQINTTKSNRKEMNATVVKKLDISQQIVRPGITINTIKEAINQDKIMDHRFGEHQIEVTNQDTHRKEEEHRQIKPILINHNNNYYLDTMLNRADPFESLVTSQNTLSP